MPHDVESVKKWPTDGIDSRIEIWVDVYESSTEKEQQQG